MFDFVDEHIELCTGKKLAKLSLDIKYEVYKICSKNEIKIRELFENACYNESHGDAEYSKACDLMETDSIEFLWRGLDFVDLIESNSIKYI